MRQGHCIALVTDTANFAVSGRVYSLYNGQQDQEYANQRLQTQWQERLVQPHESAQNEVGDQAYRHCKLAQRAVAA